MVYVVSDIHEWEYDQLVQLWEASVRATHHFLNEEDIQYFKPLIRNNYLYDVTLKVARNKENFVIGFLGVAEDNIEMLFIHPDYSGKGAGKALVNYAINKLGARKVDVNEQNQQAVGFYERLGFKTTSRSGIDAFGKPYSILHMELD